SGYVLGGLAPARADAILKRQPARGRGLNGVVRMHRSTLCSFAAAVSAAALPPLCPAARQADTAFPAYQGPACQGGPPAAAAGAPLRVPSEFVANAGQWHPAARFLLQQGNVRTWVIDEGFVVDAADGDRGVAVRFTFAGAEGRLGGQLPSATRRH